MYVTSYISRVRHTWDGTAGRRRRWIFGVTVRNFARSSALN